MSWKFQQCCCCRTVATKYQGLNGLEFEQAPGVGDEQGSLACCSPRS